MAQRPTMHQEGRFFLLSVFRIGRRVRSLAVQVLLVALLGTKSAMRQYSSLKERVRTHNGRFESTVVVVKCVLEKNSCDVVMPEL